MVVSFVVGPCRMAQANHRMSSTLHGVVLFANQSLSLVWNLPDPVVIPNDVRDE